MQSPQSDPEHEPARAAVLVPLRSLREGKLRLASVRSADERADLIESMARAVIEAAHDMPVLVVHDEPAVADWAQALGADTIRGSEPGLNRAVAEGHRLLRSRGHDLTIVAHADLPFARDLRPIAEGDGITLVPDRLRDGTNVMAVPTDLDFDFSYGPGSFSMHLKLAQQSGREVHVIDDPDLSLDIDHPDDLDLLDQETP
ncbi:MAG: 2-phospho-L-lactate guanylyltransferase [Acidimicrobiales bacterium]